LTLIFSNEMSLTPRFIRMLRGVLHDHLCFRCEVTAATLAASTIELLFGERQ